MPGITDLLGNVDCNNGMAHDSVLYIKTSDDDSELFSAHASGKGGSRTNLRNPDTPLLRFLSCK